MLCLPQNNYCHMSLYPVYITGKAIMSGVRQLLTRILGGEGRKSGLTASHTPSCWWREREVRGCGMAGTCERERERERERGSAHVVWGVGIGQCCIYSASAVCT